MGIMKKLLVMGVSLFACAISVFSKENFKFVDISDIADTPFGASIEGEFAPFKKLSGDTAVNLGGIDFKLCGEALRVLSQKKIKISVRPPNDRYRYLYILSNSGDKVIKDNERKNMAHLYINSNKYQIKLYPKKHIVGGSAVRKDFLENAKAVYGGDGEPYLYISRIPVEQIRNGIAELEIKPENHVSWNIFAITLSDKKVPTGKTYKLGGNEWKPVDIFDTEIADGSALDLSGLMTQAPAGKFGRAPRLKRGGGEGACRLTAISLLGAGKKYAPRWGCS